MGFTTQPATGLAEIDGLLSGSRWTGTVTFGFPDSASDYPAGYGDEPSNAFFAISYYQQEVVRYAFALVESYTNLAFSYAGTVIADIAFGQTSLAETAYAYYPGSGAGGDVWFGDDFRNPRVGDYAYLTHLHEIGHSLGLSHPHESDNPIGVILPAQYDWLGYTVMSYRSQANGPLSYSLPQFHFPTTFMALDILALQTMYGADYTTNSGSTVYSWSEETGQQFINGVAQLMPGSGSGYFGDGASNHVYMTVWDGGGADTFDFSGYGLTSSQSLSINLSPGGATNLPNGRVYNSFLFNGDTRSLIEHAIGSVNNDSITGNDASNRLDGRAGDDHLYGGRGHDMLIGGDGDDVLDGDVGNDTLSGGEGDDRIDAGRGNDSLSGGSGNDTMTAGLGDDSIEAGTGYNTVRGSLGDDTVSFDFNFLDALIRFLPDGSIYIGTVNGFTIVRSVEVLQFADGSFDVASLRPTDDVAPTTVLSEDNLVVTPPGTTPYPGQGVAMQFSEEVTLGSGSIRVYYSDGTLYRTYSVDELWTENDTVFFPYPTDAGQYYVQADPGVVVDTSGNEFAGISGRNAWNFYIGVRSDDYPDYPSAYSGLLTVNNPATGGYLSDTNDADTFRVNLPGEQLYALRTTVSNANGAQDSVVFVTNSSGTTIGQGILGETIYFTAPYQTQYYISVSNQYLQTSTPGDYSLRVVTANDDHAGDASTTSLLSAGSSLAGIAQGVADLDWMRMDLVAGQTYRLTISGGSDASNVQAADQMVMTILNEDGSTVILPLPGGYGQYAVLHATDAGQFVFTADRTGTFYVQVQHQQDYYTNGWDYGGGTYTVELEQGGFSTPEMQSATASGGANAAPYTDIVLTFDEAVFAGEGFLYIGYGSLIGGPNGLAIDVNDSTQVQIQGNVIRINPSVDLPAGSYAVHFDAGALVGQDGSLAGMSTSASNQVRIGYYLDTYYEDYYDDYASDTATLGRVSPGESVIASINNRDWSNFTPGGPGFNSSYDSDWFRIDLVAGETYDINLLIGSGIQSFNPLYDDDIDLAIMDSSGLVVAQDLANSGGGANSRILFTATQTGTYYLAAILATAVGGYSNNPGYELRVDTPAGIEVTGTSAADVLNGSAGFDRIDGLAGADTMRGGAGDDTYFVDNSGDRIVESSTGGRDHVLSSISYELSSTLENLTLTGHAAIDGTGNALANRLTGNSANNVLDGRGGADAMRGGGGDDTYHVDDPGDSVTEYSGQGTDIVYSSVSFTLGSNVENLTLTGSAVRATGNALGNRLVGNGGDNLLDGRGGADVMRGALGDDTYYVDNTDDLAIENAGQGIDLVYSSVNYRLREHVENLQLTGSAVRAYGNSTANRLVGNNGNNILDGRGGADVMRGGTGDDTYFVDNSGDRPIENGGEGYDTVYSAISLNLSSNIESLALTGSAVRANGNSLDNRLVGTSGDNILNGGAGADVMRGGLGNDRYYVDNAGDNVVEEAGAGRDRIYSEISYALGSNQDDLFARGSSALNLTGNSLDNVLRGNSASNVLTGRGGADDLRGGGGSDIFVFDDPDFAGLSPSTSDRIIDFSQAEGDLIDLSAVDANSGLGGDQAFAFIGTGAFTNVAGQLRYDIINGNTYVTGDTNGDGAADFMIRLDGSHALIGGDFVI